MAPLKQVTRLHHITSELLGAHIYNYLCLHAQKCETECNEYVPKTLCQTLTNAKTQLNLSAKMSETALQSVLENLVKFSDPSYETSWICIRRIMHLFCLIDGIMNFAIVEFEDIGLVRMYPSGLLNLKSDYIQDRFQDVTTNIIEGNTILVRQIFFNMCRLKVLDLMYLKVKAADFLEAVSNNCHQLKEIKHVSLCGEINQVLVSKFCYSDFPELLVIRPLCNTLEVLDIYDKFQDGLPPTKDEINGMMQFLTIIHGLTSLGSTFVLQLFLNTMVEVYGDYRIARCKALIGQKLQTIHLDNTSRDIVEDINIFNNIKVLSLRIVIPTEIADVNIPFSSNSFPNLTRLDLDTNENVDISAIIVRCPSLENFYCGFIEQGWFKWNGTTSFQKLDTFIVRCSAVPVDNYNWFALVSSNVKSLEVYNVPQLEEGRDNLIAVIQELDFPLLEKFMFTFRKFTDDDVRTITRRFNLMVDFGFGYTESNNIEGLTLEFSEENFDLTLQNLNIMFDEDLIGIHNN